MRLRELRTALTRILDDAAVDGDSPVIVEGYTEDGDLMQGSVESVTTEARCEGDDDHQAVYINLGEETARLTVALSEKEKTAAKSTPMPSKAEDHRDPISGAPIPNIQIKWPDAELTTTERQAVLAAFRSISEIVDHDSRVYCIAQEQACWLASELRDASPAPALSSGEEHPIHDWIPFSKRARHETIIKAARAVVDNARDQGRDDCMDDLVDEQHVEQLRQALDALDADWPKTGPFTRPDQEKKT